MEQTYKIGEAAALLNLKTYVLRFWETEFPQIAPLRTEKGQRLYTQNDIDLLRRIQFLLHEQGLTIDGARRALTVEARRNNRPPQTSQPPLPAHEENRETPVPATAPLQTELSLFAEASALVPAQPETAPQAKPEPAEAPVAPLLPKVSSAHLPPNGQLQHVPSPVAPFAEQTHALQSEAVQALIADLEIVAEILRGNHDTRKFLQ